MNVSLFAELDAAEMAALDDAADRYGAHMEVPATLRIAVDGRVASPE